MYVISVLSGAHVILVLGVIIVFVIVIAGIWVLNKRSNIQKINNQTSNTTFDQRINDQGTPRPTIFIPDSCPFCKRPNTRRTRLCEWCGEQIC